MKNLGFISTFAFIAVLITLISTQSNNQLSAGGVDVEVGENSWITVFNNSEGDHMIRLENDSNKEDVILHHYRFTQHGNIVYHGFRNISYDYLIAGTPSGTLASTGASGSGLTPKAILTDFYKHYKKDKAYKDWEKTYVKTLPKQDDDYYDDNPLKLLMVYLKEQNLVWPDKKPEPGTIRMTTMFTNSGLSMSQTLLVTDHTNKVIMTYVIDSTKGLQLTSVRNIAADEGIADQMKTDLLALRCTADDPKYTPQAIQVNLTQLQQSKAKRKGKAILDSTLK